MRCAHKIYCETCMYSNICKNSGGKGDGCCTGIRVFPDSPGYCSAKRELEKAKICIDMEKFATDERIEHENERWK